MGLPAAAMLAFSVLSTVASAKMQADAANAAAEDQAAIAQAQINEIERQKGEVNKQADDEKSLRVRQAEADLARARVASAEGFGMINREIGEIGYVEGFDLSRIESNRKGQMAAMRSQQEAAKQGGVMAYNNAKRTSSAARTSAVLGTIGAGVSIGASAYGQQQQLHAAKRDGTEFNFNWSGKQ